MGFNFAAGQKRFLGETMFLNEKLLFGASAIALSLMTYNTNDANANGGAFSIAVDDKVVYQDGKHLEKEEQYKLEAAKLTMVNVVNDGLDTKAFMNVESFPFGKARIGEEISFIARSNLDFFTVKEEVRIFEAGQSLKSKPIDIVPLDAKRETSMIVSPDLGEREYIFVYRAYDKDGEFNETAPKRIEVISRDFEVEGEQDEDERTIEDTRKEVWNQNTLTVDNIDAYGAGVSLYANNVKDGEKVMVFGKEATQDGAGKFVSRQILPEGEHDIAVEFINEATGEKEREVLRSIYVEDDEWFYVALGEITIGQNDAAKPTGFVGSSDVFDDDVYVDGRAAFYVKGKVNGKWKITAQADTGEGDIEEIFRNIDKKDPRHLVRRLDDEVYFPTYGDDSHIVDETPGAGKFYVKVEKNKSHILWGGFHTNINESDLARVDRSLYGAEAVYKSEDSTEYGETRYTARAFVANAETLGSFEEFQGTGGSLYYLKHQDLTRGSAKVSIEVRDQNTGIVLESKLLTSDQDYYINHIQGRITLNSPLNSQVSSGSNVTNGSLGGNPQYLVVNYEYTPEALDVDEATFGGRVEGWVTDSVRIGATAMKNENSNGTNGGQEVYGGDVIARYNPTTYIKGEYVSTGEAGGESRRSLDGGFNYTNLNSNGTNKPAAAFRVEAATDLEDINGKDVQVSAYYEDKEAGFSGTGAIAARDITNMGAEVRVGLAEHSDVFARLGNQDEDGGIERSEIELGASAKLSDSIAISGSILHDMYEQAGATRDTGDRTDVGGRIEWIKDEETGDKLYLFGQVTLDNDATRRENSRIGLGADYRLNDDILLSGEVSTGNGGIGASFNANYNYDEVTDLYAGYALQSTSNDATFLTSQVSNNTNGTVTVGAKRRFSDALSVFGEERMIHNRNEVGGFTHAYGMDYKITDRWTFGLTTEIGEVRDTLNVNNDIERKAGTVSVGYTSDVTKFNTVVEYRDEESSVETRETMLAKVSFGYDISEDSELLARVDMAVSESDVSAASDSEYVEGYIGYALRPLDNDNLNLLAKYSFLYDLPANQQLSGTEAAINYKQRSHIFNIDAIWQATDRLSIGAKYGLKIGEITSSRITDDWFKSTVQLAVLRLDYHVVNNWDILAEARYLSVKEAEDAKFGALVAAYYHLGSNVKVGLGYNFTDFSDDLTNLSYDAQGWFVNLITKF